MAPPLTAPASVGALPCPGKSAGLGSHALACRDVTGRFGLDADMVGVRSGVTTVVDQETPVVWAALDRGVVAGRVIAAENPLVPGTTLLAV